MSCSCSSWRCSSRCSSTRSSAGLGRARIPRGAAVALVYLAFAAVVALAILVLATVVVQQTRSAAHRVDNYFTADSGHPPQTGAEQDLGRLQRWLDHHHLGSVHVEKEGQKFLDQVGTKDVQKYTTKALHWAEGAGLTVVTLLFDAILARRRLDLHAARHAAADGGGRPALPAARSRRPDRADGAGGGELRQGPVPALADHRHERRARALDSRDGGPDAERREIRRGVRRVGGLHRAHPVHRAVARRDPAGAVRARPAPALGALGRAPLPRHPAARGPRRGTEGDGALVAPPSAARDLRPARGRRDLRLRRDPRRAAAARRRPRRVGVLRRADRAGAVAGRCAARRDRPRACGRRQASPPETPPAPAA